METHLSDIITQIQAAKWNFAMLQSFKRGCSRVLWINSCASTQQHLLTWVSAVLPGKGLLRYTTSQPRSWTRLSHVQRTSWVNWLDIRLVVGLHSCQGTSFGLVYMCDCDTCNVLVLCILRHCFSRSCAGWIVGEIRHRILAVSHWKFLLFFCDY